MSDIVYRDIVTGRRAARPIRYAFVEGGFAAVDDECKVGAFAYATSTDWQMAKAMPHERALLMLAKAGHCPAHIEAEQYARMCEALS